MNISGTVYLHVKFYENLTLNNTAPDILKYNPVVTPAGLLRQTHKHEIFKLSFVFSDF